ncbi:hypothetical protein HPP92_013035 [Vanilla planifolia]|uniref:Uncharacterized protein n=1 Tax=Vanilla planifolia TaxID=51239 RepID=A0A835V088_VANPL|nr:hypothetical protein HPP92_013035 [Vanilla planifolia]
MILGYCIIRSSSSDDDNDVRDDGNLRGLKSLNRSFNSLIGEITTSPKKLKEVESLSLAHNILLGEIPWSSEELLELTTLDLSSNKLVCKQQPPLWFSDWSGL